MGRRMKKVENDWFKGSTHFHSKNVGEANWIFEVFAVAVLQ